jgi:hypothetical protein
VTSCIVNSAAIYIMVVKFRNTICPSQLQLSLLRRAALSSDSNGTRTCIVERTQSAVYIVRCLWSQLATYSTVVRYTFLTWGGFQRGTLREGGCLIPLLFTMTPWTITNKRSYHTSIRALLSTMKSPIDQKDALCNMQYTTQHYCHLSLWLKVEVGFGTVNIITAEYAVLS